ncbi:hypothetical protein [Humitalea rosea]|uniref:hypothetical protein n=1 Tax=Humitalea rosea TaxID=990373 RepID=UPI000DAD3C31|nr:hypothetical protein [Humitalea rosea]
MLAPWLRRENGAAEPGPTERIEALLAFALSAEGADPAPLAADVMARRRAEADRLLTEHAFRLLHNRVEEIRGTATAEALRGLRAPPGFVTLVLAVLVGLGVAAGAVLLAHRLGYL